MKGNIFKRAAAAVLALLLVFGSIPAGSDFTGLFSGSVMSASAETINNLEYSILDDDTVEIIAYHGDDSTVVIPEQIEGMSVTSIGEEAFYNNTALTRITIPDSVTNIGRRAFSGCTRLSDAFVLPASLESIGEAAFTACAFTSVTIPAKVTSIGANAFLNCFNCTDVYCFAKPNNLSWDDSDCNDFMPDKATKCYVPGKLLGAYKTKFGSSVNVTFLSEDSCGENATWEFDSETGKLTISGTGAMYDYNGMNMPWIEEIENIKSIEIGEGITAIGEWAFANLSNAASVVIPSSVTTIGEGAFAVCGFSSIDIPSTVTSIGSYAFTESKLINVTIPGGVTVINKCVFQGCDLLESVVIPQGVTSIGGSAFAGCKSLKTAALPEGVTSIGKFAFENCESLKIIVIPSTVTSIDDCAFNGCNAVDDVFLLVNDPTNLEWGTGTNVFKPGMETKCHVPSETADAYRTKFNEEDYNVTFVDDLDSYKCGDSAYWALTDTDGDETPDKLTISGTGDMWDYDSDSDVPWHENADNIITVETADGITRIGDHVFDSCTSLGSVTIPDSVTAIGDFAFYSSELIEDVALPGKLTSIGEGAFAYCTSLKNISIPKSVTTIGNMAFSFCSTLEDLSFADESELETIGEYAFSGCALIESVTIPAGVTSIGEDAFFGCTSCTDVYCLVADPTKLEWTDGGFDDFIYDEDDPDTHNVTRCHVPARYLADYEENFSDVNVTFVSDFCGDNAYWTLTDTDKDGTADKLTISGTGDMWDFGGTNPVPYIDYWAGIKTVVISDGITSIGNEAFYEYSAIESVTIADSVTSIGECAFYDCDALKTITIPANVTSIGEHAFDNCSALTTVNYGENSKLKTIGQCAFFGCSAIGSVTIPANVIEIGLFAFRGCALIESVTIPAGVTSIGEEAFFGCTSCTDVYCLVADPTKLEWTDGIFDDFIYDEDDPDTHKVTKCHVPKGTLEAYKAKFSTGNASTDVNVTFVADVTATVADGITHGSLWTRLRLFRATR